ncbi:MAG TPA: hypothetical protein VK176_15920 [Phycisphaerales bacterium]|nr:hypothetical protein [Phycisphaerales bacterium]
MDHVDGIAFDRFTSAGSGRVPGDVHSGRLHTPRLGLGCGALRPENNPGFLAARFNDHAHHQHARAGLRTLKHESTSSSIDRSNRYPVFIRRRHHRGGE